MAIRADSTMKNAMKARMTIIFFFSLIPFFVIGEIKSSVMVEDDVRTREDSVDMDADRTSTSTTAMSISGRFESMVGMTLSNPPTGFPSGPGVRNALAKPPRK